MSRQRRTALIRAVLRMPDPKLAEVPIYPGRLFELHDQQNDLETGRPVPATGSGARGSARDRAAERSAAIQKSKHLTRDQRRALVLLVEGMSAAQAAKRMKKSPRDFRRVVSRAKDRLRKYPS